MFNETAARISRFVIHGLSHGARTRRVERLNTDELSEHMLRDLGLADGHTRPLEEPERRQTGHGDRQEQLILTPFAS